MSKMSKMKYQTNWIPQFGAPVLPPAKPKSRRSTKKRRGSWQKPSEAMRRLELSKCKITKMDLRTGEVLAVIEPTSRAKPKLYGSTGRNPHIPQKT